MAEVTLTIDGREVTVAQGTTIIDAAQRLDIDIPVLCHDPRMKPVGVCRMCVVDVGGRVLAAACVRPCTDGMNVTTQSDTVDGHRKVLTELLMSDQPSACAKEGSTGDSALHALARTYQVDGSRFPGARAQADGGRVTDDSSKVIAVDHDACILCDRCIRACDDIQSNEVIGRTGKGYGTRIGFDLDDPMGNSSCVSCGECLAVCPTGALVNKRITLPIAPRKALRAVDSVCPYCGVGCSLTYHVDVEKNRIVYADGRASVVNDERLCVKGRYGFDYATHEQRLTKPLIRKDSHYPKRPLSPEMAGDIGPGKKRRRGSKVVKYEDVMPAFREATWDEALDLVAKRLLAIRDSHGGSALAGFGSAKCSNEEAYVFQKLMRAVFKTNNVDHCTRLCHASSVAALLETIGSGAVTNTFAGIAESDFALFTGTNTTHNHPVAATFFKEAAKRGAKILVIDPRRPDLADHAWRYARIKPGSDVAFYNGVMHVIVRDGLMDQAYVDAHTEGFDALKTMLDDYSPEVAAKLSGVEPALIEEIAHAYASAKAAMTFWGMGISQHTHGTDNARCLISLCLLTGNMGRPGTGLHPLRGQNNVQGASDAGLIPMVYPDYQSVADPAVQKKFEDAWGVDLDPSPGLTVTEITEGAHDGTIKGLYCLGENPFLSDPNVTKVRKAICNLDFLVVQDIFLTETAEVADVILPASSYMEKKGTYTNTDRRVQIGHPALKLPGEARLDWEIVCEIATRMGYPMTYDGPEAIFEEFAALTTSYADLDYANIGTRGRLWPAPDRDAPDGIQVLFGGGFPTTNGRGKFVPCTFKGAVELPSDDYPMVLNTGRMLEHWHTGTMTRRAKALDGIAPEALVEVHPDDLAALSLADGDMVTVTSRRGRIELRAKAKRRVQRGTVFVAFHFREAAANLLTIDAIDPDGKIPEYKFCAVKLEPAADAAE
jgi:formate dehydrogenase major subunit